MDDNITILSIRLPDAWIGKSLIDLNVRQKYHITVVAIKRKNKMTVNPRPDLIMEKDDMLIILGDSESVRDVTESL